MQGQTGADTDPQVGRLDLEEHASPVVGDPLPVNAYRLLGNLGAQPDAGEGTYGVAGQVDSGALGRLGGVAFDDLDLRTPTAQGASRGQASDTGADDQNSNTRATH
jgi:hypothetical protein